MQVQVTIPFKENLPIFYSCLKNSTALSETQGHTNRTNRGACGRRGAREGAEPTNLTAPHPIPPRQLSAAAREAVAIDTASDSPHLPPRAAPQGVWGSLSYFHPSIHKEESGLQVSSAQARTHGRFLPSEGVPSAGTGTRPPRPGPALPVQPPGNGRSRGAKTFQPRPGTQSPTLHGAGPAAAGSSGSVRGPSDECGGACKPGWRFWKQTEGVQVHTLHRFACGLDKLHSLCLGFVAHGDAERTPAAHSCSFYEHLHADHLAPGPSHTEIRLTGAPVSRGQSGPVQHADGTYLNPPSRTDPPWETGKQ